MEKKNPTTQTKTESLNDNQTGNKVSLESATDQLNTLVN